MTAALLQTERSIPRRWLSFPRPPPASVRKALLAAGWQFHGGHRAWFTDDAAVPVPAGFAVGAGGACDLATARPVRGAAVLELLRSTRERIGARGGAVR